MDEITALHNRLRPTKWRAEILLSSSRILASVLWELTFGKRISTPAAKSRDFSTPRQRTVLILSYYSPPYKSSFGTQRVAKFAKYLSELGWRVIFVTTDPRNPDERGADATELGPPVEIIRIQAMKHHPLVWRGVLPPDHFLPWLPSAVRTLEGICSANDVSVLFATVPPYTNALAAAVVSARLGVPLVVDFRDPWSRIDVVWRLKYRLSRALSAYMEALVLRSATRVIMVDPIDYADDYFVKVGAALRRKLHCLSNGYDESDFVGLGFDRYQDASSFVITYVGGLYSTENADFIVSVVRGLCERRPEFATKVSILYAGSNGEMLRGLNELPCSYDDLGYVSHADAIQIRARCHLQVFSQPPSFKRHVTSGKIYEMIRARVPIIAFTHPDGAVGKILEETGAGEVFSMGMRDAAVDYLVASIERWMDSGGSSLELPEADISLYSRRGIATRLSDILDDVAASRCR